MDCISLGRVAMIKPDTLDKAQAEDRAPWKDVVHEFKDIVSVSYTHLTLPTICSV